MIFGPVFRRDWLYCNYGYAIGGILQLEAVFSCFFTTVTGWHIGFYWEVPRRDPQ